MAYGEGIKGYDGGINVHWPQALQYRATSKLVWRKLIGGN